MTKKLIWRFVFILAAVGVGVGLSAKPWQIYRQQRKLADGAIQEMRQAEASKADLTRKKARYESFVGREELIRNAGYRTQDETPLATSN